MERFFEHDLLVAPGETIVARSKRNHAALSFAIQDFEEHVPASVSVQHKRIGNEFSFDIRDVRVPQNRIISCSAKLKRRIAGVDADGPH